MSPFLHRFRWPPGWMRRRQPVSKKTACASPSCPGRKSVWQNLRSRQTGSFLDEKFYCQPRCLETALVAQIARLRNIPQPVPPPNRIPLGLLMVARGKLTHVEVRAALEAQRRAGYGKIGDWLEKLGFASEQEVTAALAVQWGCPLVSSFDLGIVDMPGSIPLPILESFQMLPANYTAATNTLYLAFGERVDHAALYTIERTLDCRTQPCVAQRRKIACRLDDLRQMPRPGDVEFVTRDFGEMARITSSYVNRVNPEQVRICRMGSFIWLRLKARAAATNLVFNLVPKRAPSRVGFLESSSLSLASLTYSTPSAPGASDEMPLPLGD